MKSLQEMIDVMEASKTKKVESCSLKCGEFCDWKECEKPGWNWVGFDYRVKAQEPRRVWIAHYDKRLFVLDVPDSTLSNAAEYVELTKEIRERLGL